MFPAPAQHRFGPDNAFLLVRFSRAGERRITQNFALSLSMDGVTPGLLQSLDGDNRYAEAVLRECLKEAPAHWWEVIPPQAVSNGQPQHVLSFEQVMPEEFQFVADEAARWLTSFRPTQLTGEPDGGAAESTAVAPAEAVPTAFRGRAE